MPNTKLFQEKITARMKATARPGRAIGIATCQNTCQRVAPSISADSSSSIGVVSKYPIMIQITIGTVTTRWMMICGQSVPSRPSHWNRRNSGMR